MPPLEFVVPIACFLLCGLYLRHTHTGPQARARKAESLLRFFERTEYRVVGLQHLPLAVQARRWIDAEHARPYVRELDEGRLLHAYALPRELTPHGLGAGQPGWVLELRRPARVAFSLVDLRHTDRDDLDARLGPRIPLDDRELDRRCRAHGGDAWAVRVILQSPELRESLRACVDIELHVTRDRIVFVDRNHRNLHAGAGGLVALMATPQERAFDGFIVPHERIAELLAQAARASREVA